MNEVHHAVFVYRNLDTREIKCFYAEEARAIQNDANFEHLATLNPRLWIQWNWENVEGGE